MPILSFSANKTIRDWIKRLIQKKVYKSQSNVIRDALTRMMASTDLDGLVSESAASDASITSSARTTTTSSYKTGIVTIVVPKGNPAVRRALKKVERNFSLNLKSRQMTNDDSFRTIVYTFEGTLGAFQRFTVQMNSIEDLLNLRYLIVE